MFYTYMTTTLLVHNENFLRGQTWWMEWAGGGGDSKRGSKWGGGVIKESL